MSKIGTLKTQNNENFYPKTLASAVYMEDGQTTVSAQIT